MPHVNEHDIIGAEYKAMQGQVNVDEAQGIVECFAAGLGNKDSVGDICLPGCFNESLKRRKPRVVWGHNWNEPIGKVLEIYEVGPNDPRLPMKMKRAGIGGLYAKVQFNLKSERGRQAFADVSFFGEEQEWSIGYKTLNADYDSQRQANLLREVELYEVSPVLHGANQLTGTISIKSEDPSDMEEDEEKGKYPTSIYRAEREEDSDDDYTGPRGPDGGVPAGNPAMGRAGNLARALAMRFGGAVRLRNADPNMAIFDHMDKQNKKQTLRVTYHFDGDEFMFGNPVKVRQETVYLPVEKPDVDIDDREEMPSSPSPITQRYQQEMEEYPALPRGVKPKVCKCGCTGKTEDQEVPEEENLSDEQRKFKQYLDSLSDEQFDKAFPENEEMAEEEKVVFDVIGAYARRAITNRRKRKKDMDIKAPQDAILDVPQEQITGDIMRGYGPRRGNLEKLLRYWRPIMKKPGGFRRCKVILADHPELYPLNNICAWLHHETTGLWPNEGCHHPGMKNCKKKIRGVRDGSVFTDSQFNERLESAFKKGDDMDDLEGMSPEEWEKTAMTELKSYFDSDPEMKKYINDDSNWEHEGEEEKGGWVIHGRMDPDQGKKPGGCGCGCDGPASSGPKPVIRLMNVMSELEKSITEEMQTKAGRVISNSNMQKLQQAMELLQQVVTASKPSDEPVVQVKSNGMMRITAPVNDLFDIKSLIDPIIDFHGIDAEVGETGIYFGSSVSTEAKSAMINALSAYKDSHKQDNH